MEDKRNIFSLHALNQSLERHIRDTFALKSYWVIAEITKAQEKNGHHYLELADSKDGKRVAEMSANMWFSTFNRVDNHLNGELKAIFKHGNKVLVNVRIEFHPIYGLKLNILDVDPTITYGELEKQKKATIKRLKKEGLYDLQQALKLPAIIKKVALIGSQNTSGYRDFLTELLENRIYTNFKVKEFSVSVQGDRATKEVTKAIKEAQTYNVDVIVIVRGGGSKMDLNVFNGYEIAKTIAESEIPIITGIGHETDDVIADLVANKYEITPTAVAKFLYVRAGIFKSDLQGAFDSVLKISQQLIAVTKDEFTHTSKYLVHYTQNLIREHNNLIKDSIHQLHIGVTETIESERSKLDLNLSKVGNNAKNTIALKKSTELNSRLDMIHMLSLNNIERSKIGLNNLAELLMLLNPEELLKKGYTISTINNVDLINYDGDLKDATLKTLSSQHLITSKIVTVKKHE
ncbi:MAG: exodeoxyribonuclease VII large subunit [Crocinitomix sp.]